jgi:hypothetical protein
MQPICLIPPLVACEQGLQEVYRSNYGILYQGDCLNFLRALPDSVQTLCLPIHLSTLVRITAKMLAIA